MKLMRRAFLVALLCVLMPLGAAAAVAAVALGDDQAGIPLVPQARIIYDADGRLDAAALLRMPVDAGMPGNGEIASFGFSKATYWFSLTLDNRDGAVLHRLLVFEPPWLDDVHVTLHQPDGTRVELAGGDLLPFSARTLAHRKINVELALPPGESRLLVRVRTSDPFLVGMTLWERGAFFAAEGAEASYYGFLYGAIGSILLFNLFLFFSMREKAYGAYVAYLLAFLVMHATYNGHLYPLLWPDSPQWSNWTHSLFIYLFMLSGTFFAIHFLELDARLPRARRWAEGFMLALLASAALTAAFGGYRLQVSSSILWVVAYSPFLLLIGVLSLTAGNRAARYFLPATAAGFLGSFITAATVADLVPYTLHGYRAVDYGMLIDAILLSMALADRVRLSRAEADQAKVRLIETGRAYAHQLEETVAARTLELSRANAVKDQFFAIVAHDLRGPIGSLATYLDDVAAKAGKLDDAELTVFRGAMHHLRDFMENLLTWARSQRGDIDYRPEAFDIGLLLAEIEALCTAQARAKGVDLALTATGTHRVYVDRASTHAVLRNLVGNAIKYTAAGGSVRGELERDADCCVLRIVDSGVGMDERQVQSLFRLDVKPSSALGTANEHGTGLGLILCKEFVEKNGGTIGVRSSPGQGSTFWITLPWAPAAVPTSAGTP